MTRDHPEGSILLGAISRGKPSSVVMEGRKNPEKLLMCHPISYLVPPNKTDISKSKKVKLPKNSKGHPLAMQRRKKSLFKKASELSTLCGIDVCIIVYDDQNPKTTIETWPHSCNDVFRMVKRCKGRMSEDREKKLKKEKILSDVHSAQIQSQTHSDFSSEMQNKDVPYDIENVCSPTDIILEDKECCNNLDESITTDPMSPTEAFNVFCDIDLTTSIARSLGCSETLNLPETKVDKLPWFPSPAYLFYLEFVFIVVQVPNRLTTNAVRSYRELQARKERLNQPENLYTEMTLQKELRFYSSFYLDIVPIGLTSKSASQGYHWWNTVPLCELVGA
ncbi:Transcription factor, MADS-box [Dillenia turbinata]|uniref:Transcription factor, MADS-box n=1 Tax=Dillenia turbinata TaxID=194707 RepID=A0AAN8YZ27_9MAGN